MSFGFREDRLRRQQRGRAIWRAILMLVLIAAFGAVYWFGLEQGQVDMTDANARIAELTESEQRLQRRAGERDAEIVRLGREIETLRQRLEAETPTGAVRPLYELLQARLRAGVTPDRLTTVLQRIENQRQCDAVLQRRVAVRTAIDRTSPNSLQFGDQAVTLFAEGISVRTAEGAPEAWYDPAQQITLRFQAAGGRASDAQGRVPFQHQVVVGDSEWRFSFTAGTRGFLNVAAERCSFP